MFRHRQLHCRSYFLRKETVVTDTSTDLMWQQRNDANTYRWEAALDYCKELNLSGYDDWRLPNIRELLSLVDDTQGNPAINPAFATQKDGYWSGTTLADRPTNGWYVAFGHVGVVCNHCEIGFDGLIRLCASLFPIPKRAERDVIPRGKFLLCQVECTT